MWTGKARSEQGSGRRVTSAGPHTESRKAKQDGEVYDAASSCRRASAAGIVSFTETRCVARGGWPDMGGYGLDLESRLTELHERVHRGAYRAQPSRRVMIPRGNGKQRPLAIAALEDKIVQKATLAVLNC
jgi:hypothetical protein